MKNENVIITRTPLRVSFIGGGTDMPYFYEKFGGATISCAIKKYIYVTVKYNHAFSEKFRLNSFNATVMYAPTWSHESNSKYKKKLFPNNWGDELKVLDNEEIRLNRMCEINVVEQVATLAHTKIVQTAWQRKQPLEIHGWIYGINDGVIKDLNVSRKGLEDVDDIYQVEI
jgi:hypothetical protein